MSRSFDDITVLIPSHSLEDFPTELPEEQAASLLHAFAAAWHPAVLARLRVMPGWDRADEPPIDPSGRLFLVPMPCQEWLPHAWEHDVAEQGGRAIVGLSDRESWTTALLEALGSETTCEADLVADFFALGTCHLLVELLSRQMHHFGELDEAHLQRVAVSAADAAMVGDAETARTHLRSAFESLAEARERFYPVDCYLVDLCLLTPETADEHLQRLLASGHPASLMLTGEALDEIAAGRREVLDDVRKAWERGEIDVLGGEWHEGPAPLLPVQSLLWQFVRGHDSWQRHLGRRPTSWGRRRFGVSPLMPLILNRFGYRAALHLVFDDGIYPDVEQSRIRWEGRDGSVIDAASRIPLPADSAVSYLRFPVRMAESMQEDQVAAVFLARWPEVRTPWLDDLRRMARFAPVLGRWVTLEQFFEQSDSPGRLSTFAAEEYFTPFLLQAVAYQEPDAISRFADHHRRRHLLDAGLWVRAVTEIVCGKAVDEGDSARKTDGERADLAERMERLVEQAAPNGDTGRSADTGEHAEADDIRSDADAVDPAATGRPGEDTDGENADGNAAPGVNDNPSEAENAADATSPAASTAASETTSSSLRTDADAEMNQPDELERQVQEFARSAAETFHRHVLGTEPQQSGWLVLNTLSFPRRAVLTLDGSGGLPAVDDTVRIVQADRRLAVVDLPPSGFVWIEAQSESAETGSTESETVLAEDGLLQNEFFILDMNEQTGGIARIKGHGRSPNRLSQQLAFRFPTQRTVRSADDEDAPPTRTYYSEMRCTSQEVLSTGPVVGEILSRGVLVDPETDDTVAEFSQWTRIWRGRPLVEVEIELQPHRLPEGDPWTNYYAVRFAWNDATAVLTRSFQEGAHGVRGPRFEAPDYLEIASDSHRTTILPLGRPFWRITGPRMVDHLLIVAGERRRRFSFRIALDRDFPMQEARDAVTPPVVLPTTFAPAAKRRSGWFFHLDAKNVQVVRLQAPLPHNVASETQQPWAEHDNEPIPAGSCRLRLMETEGRRRLVRLRVFRKPQSARQIDFAGRTISELAVEDDCVLIEMAPYEIADVLLGFAP